MKTIGMLVSWLLLVTIPGLAEVRLPHALSDHAVLQRDRPIHVWGWATPGARLSARLHNQTVAAVASKVGTWDLWFAPEMAGGPYTLTVTGDGAPVTVTDLLLGDVWFASGQSNMEMPLDGFGPTTQVKDAQEEIAHATHPKIRLLLVEKKSADYPLDDNPSTWTDCTPDTARHFSAVAYFFGREISQKENVPVGLVDSTWGGTPADSWVSLDTLGTNPQLLPAFASRAHFADPLANTDALTAAEKREDAAAVAAGQPAPKHPWHPFETSWLPAGLYNGMVAPYVPMSIKGFIWYQGETNSGHDRAPYYESLFKGLIGDWRMHFAQGDLPFYFVQISSFSSPGEDWGTVRDAQRRALALANTGMAVTLDIGLAGNVHPPDKQTVGARLAANAEAMTYGQHVPFGSPLFRQATEQMQPDGSTALQVWFEHGEGLSYHGGPATGFEVAGADGKFMPAQAKIEGETVVVSSPNVREPKFVRYGWMGVMDSNLFNAAGFPASTFTSGPEPLP